MLVVAAAALTGCLPPANPSQLLADSAFDMNVATRFGRMDVALEHVGDDARESFARTHARWGRDVRVVDIELLSLGMKGNDQADVSVSVAWQRPDDANIRTTQLAQRWQDGRGGWRMTSEKRQSGDLGLLDDRPKTAASAPEDAEKPAIRGASFQTTIIRAED